MTNRRFTPYRSRPGRPGRAISIRDAAQSRNDSWRWTTNYSFSRTGIFFIRANLGPLATIGISTGIALFSKFSAVLLHRNSR